MTAFESALLAALPEITPEPDDYEQDGLIYCGKCHTPRQLRLNAPGTGLDGKIVFCLCQCREDAQRAEESAKKAIRDRDTLDAHNKAMIEAGIADPFPAWTFDDDDNPNSEHSKFARRYVNQWESVYSENIGALLYGPPGTGKTFLAGCIANELNRQGSHVLYSSIRKLTLAANRDFGADADLVQREVQRCSLLVLDDFGVERNTEFSWEQMERIIDWRYEARKPLLCTTNLSPQEMQGGEITKRRVFDRVLEMCLTIKVDGKSRRTAEAERKKALARQILGG